MCNTYASGFNLYSHNICNMYASASNVTYYRCRVMLHLEGIHGLIMYLDFF